MAGWPWWESSHVWSGGSPSARVSGVGHPQEMREALLHRGAGPWGVCGGVYVARRVLEMLFQQNSLAGRDRGQEGRAVWGPQAGKRLTEPQTRGTLWVRGEQLWPRAC